MITSYVSPGKSMLYLSLVGPLDRVSADDLVDEYYERHDASILQVMLDLTHAADATDGGLNVLHRLSLLCQVDDVEFGVVAAGSTASEAIAEAARHYWVPIVDGARAPAAAHAGGRAAQPSGGDVIHV